MCVFASKGSARRERETLVPSVWTKSHRRPNEAWPFRRRTESTVLVNRKHWSFGTPLIEICTEETNFKDFEEKIRTQIAGMAMGKAIFGDVKGFFMESYGEEFILNPQNNEFIPAFWKREDEDV